MDLEQQYVMKVIPDFVSPDALDQYLEAGWYRMGHYIFTTHFMNFKEDFFSAVWLRLPLSNHQFKKSHRKHIKRVKEFARIIFRPARFTAEKELLFQKYKSIFKGNLSPTLLDYIMGEGEENVFNTWELCLYDNRGELIACSFFDLGDRAVASLTGIYHPGYQELSLGFVTMLLEVEFCKDNGFDFYYPGYFIPGYKRFDYKLRLGQQLEFYDAAQRSWRPSPQFNAADAPFELMLKKLKELQKRLIAQKVDADLCLYRHFNAPIFCPEGSVYIDFPVFLLIQREFSLETRITIAYNVARQTYQLMSVYPTYTLSIKDKPLSEGAVADIIHQKSIFQITGMFFESSAVEDISYALLTMEIKARP